MQSLLPVVFNALRIQIIDKDNFQKYYKQLNKQILETYYQNF